MPNEFHLSYLIDVNENGQQLFLKIRQDFYCQYLLFAQKKSLWEKQTI